ncbi:MAG TPA: hypothetical protein VFT34_05800 [Verrucomicrobiae bacterium]|nr:hypothetical protein [Verrucomicrobiae bacterium]
MNIAEFELAFADGLQSGVPDQSVITIRNPQSEIGNRESGGVGG